MTSVLVPAATSFSGSASWARRSSPGLRGSVTSSLLASLVDLVEQLHGLSWHDGGNGVFVNQLGMTIPAQKDAEVVEPGNDTLKLHPVHEKDRQGDFLLPDVVQKGVLKILRAIARH
jgi:hypothetical protein